jgi:tRNA-2-methylthio-N6-dimethylallyladenosine synthase
MPLQSGSDAVLKAMRRAYRRDRYLAILDRVRASIPDAAITTDIIVGFPGETDQDFEDTLDLVRQARFAGAFTFRYSIRPGTPAATMDGQVSAPTVQERFERLTALVEETTYAENQKLAGATVEVLVAEGEGRKDAVTHRMSGRARDNRLVHFTPNPGPDRAGPHRPEPDRAGPHRPEPDRAGPHRPEPDRPGPDRAGPDRAGPQPVGGGAPRPGDLVTVTVTQAAPHYLLSDAALLSLRRTRAGDAWEAAATASAPVAPAMAAAPPAAVPVLLGMPARHPSAT